MSHGMIIVSDVPGRRHYVRIFEVRVKEISNEEESSVMPIVPEERGGGGGQVKAAAYPEACECLVR